MNRGRSGDMQKNLMILCITVFLLSFVGTLQAEDTEIFGGGFINVPPNVLIVFDSSGSMGDTITVPGGSGESYSVDWVYKENTSNGRWEQFQYIGADGVISSSEIACDTVRNQLTTYGHSDNQRILNAAPHACNSSASTKSLRTGTYLNSVSGSSSRTDTKINIAKETIADLINTTDGVRFGLVVFNSDQGGRVVAELATRDTQAQKDSLVATINGFTANGWTPLAETLAEAGLYYARQPSWFNSGVDYASSANAIQYRCQKNYIIIMTDGESTQDKDHKLYDTNYLNSKIIGDYDNDVSTTDTHKHKSEYYWIDSSYVQHAYADSGSDYLDDVAKFLHDEDLLPAIVDDDSGVSFGTYSPSVPFSRQNIVTYTIGFDTAHKLLSDTADGQHGQGDYFTTQSNISLSDIFRHIIGAILESNSQFISPVVPVNRINNTYADNGIYLGIFAPESSTPGLWKGNLKKFGFDKNGQILQRDGTPATDSGGAITEGAHSVWGTEVVGTEGMTVDLGGAGSVLKTQATRYFKTNKPSVGMAAFNTTNVLPADLGLTNTNERDDLVNFATASGIYNPSYTGADSKSRPWILGDIIHSQPAVLYDRQGTGKNVIFVGANDGFLHCFVDNDKGTTGKTQLGDDEVREAWAFIPWDLLPNLKYLPSATTSPSLTNYITGDDTHDYFVDGSPEIYKSTNNHNYVTFGLRRGGKDLTSGGEVTNQYHILDVTNYDSPSYVAGISKNILGTEKLGQSWAAPYFCKIRGGTGQAEVLLLSGGYDINQDNDDPGSSDTKGRAVFAVNATDGSINSTFNFNHNDHSNMHYCMVDLRAYDDDEDGCDDTIYAPSVGGDLFAYENRKHTDGTYDGWSNNLLFQAQSRGGLTSKLRKFFYAPGIAQEQWGDFLYIGSGDREHPAVLTGDETTGTKTYNRFYAIRNTWEASTDPITDNVSSTKHLTDVSTDALQGTVPTPSTMTDSDKVNMRSSLATQGYGWFFDLEHPGEKIVSSPLVFNKVVYFTTFTPTTATSSGSDPCGTGIGSGTARIYAVDYKTGEAVFKNFDGNTAKLTKEDRYKDIGTGIPSQPSIVVTQLETFVLVGTEQGTNTIASGKGAVLDRYYWLKTQ
jgi:type IV pilus assembly protein PilY1